MQSDKGQLQHAKSQVQLPHHHHHQQQQQQQKQQQKKQLDKKKEQQQQKQQQQQQQQQRPQVKNAVNSVSSKPNPVAKGSAPAGDTAAAKAKKESSFRIVVFLTLFPCSIFSLFVQPHPATPFRSFMQRAGGISIFLRISPQRPISREQLLAL
jgi:outer membrane biosynthesis protein TonB